MVGHGVLTVRTRRDNRVNLVFTAGQSGVNFKFGLNSPLQRVWRSGDALDRALPGAGLGGAINAASPIRSSPPMKTSGLWTST